MPRRSLLAVTFPFVGCAAAEPPPRLPPNVVVIEEETIGVSSHPPVRRAPPEFDDTDADSVRLFHDVLAPYGTWTEDPRLGLVWMPSKESVSEAFVPYGTHGRWTYREVIAGGSREPIHEYIWLSELPWGWVTFHYGRWAYAGDRGWAWVAGRRYAGAWVDWRTAGKGTASVVGWGPTPPAHVWRISPGPREGRSPAMPRIDLREARLVPIPYAAFATPYSYVQTADVFAPDLGLRLLVVDAALGVAYTTEPGAPPSPASLGFARDAVPAPPMMDRGLQQAWMLATPATASAVGLGPELGAPPRLRTWVAGGPQWASTRYR
jgi:hypothetical protein